MNWFFCCKFTTVLVLKPIRKVGVIPLKPSVGMSISLLINVHLFNQLGSGAIVCINNQIHYINPAAYAWFKSKPPLPAPCQEVFSHLLPGIADALIGLQAANGMSATLRVGSDKQLPSDSVVKVEVSRIDDESGTTRLFLLSDETQVHLSQKRMMEAKDEAEQAAKAKSDFLATMSHEIRTPLNSIIGFTRLLLDEHGVEPYNGYLNAIQKSGESLLALVNDMLDFSRIDAGSLQINPEPLSLRELVRDISFQLMASVNEKKLQLQVNFSPEFPGSLLLDRTRVGQIINNLASNAVKFTREGGVMLDFLFSRDPDESQGALTITISDTGIGIPAEYHQKIFDVFSQVISDSARPFEGVGLGLSITRKLVLLMNGTISLESQPGRGSTFKVVFPCVKIASEICTPNNPGSDEPVREPSGAILPADLPESLIESVEKARKFFFVNDIERLCNELDNLNPDRSNQYIRALSDDLRLAANTFDMEHADILIMKIEQLIQKRTP